MLVVKVRLRGIGLVVPAAAVVQLHPIIFAILHLAGILEGLRQDVAQVVVIGCIFKPEVANIAQILVEFLCQTVSKLAITSIDSKLIGQSRTWVSLAEILDSGGLLLLTNLLVLLLVGGSLQALPRKTTPQEVHENVTQSFQVIPTGLLASQMSVDTHVSSCARQRLPLTVRNVLFSLRVAILLGHSEINNVNDIGSLGGWATDQEVIRLNIAVDQILLVDCLDAGQLESEMCQRLLERFGKGSCLLAYHLFRNHNDGLGREATVAVVEKVLKTGTQKVDHQDVVQTLLTEVVHIGNTSCVRV